jgi:hypothetical protein
MYETASSSSSSQIIPSKETDAGNDQVTHPRLSSFDVIIQGSNLNVFAFMWYMNGMTFRFDQNSTYSHLSGA